MTYGLKLIRFKNRDCYILLQNENGPCPLLAASNGLILQGQISLPISAISNRTATLDDVANMLADHAVQKHYSSRTNQSSTKKPDPIAPSYKTDPNEMETEADVFMQQQALAGYMDNNDDNNNNDNNNTTNDETTFFINELMTYIPKFQYGMDLNPKFTVGICGYEYTAEMTAFDMLQCKLVHGWLVNPFTEPDLYHAIGQKSYNELIDFIISTKDSTASNEIQLSTISSEMDAINQQCNTSTDPIVLQQYHTKLQELQIQYDTISKEIATVHLIDTFLTSTGHQLTAYGLEVLHEQLGPDEICVFFRNNHYNTIYKDPQTQSLYILVTDMGYDTASTIVWEKLDVIDGDTEFCNDTFQPNKPPPPNPSSTGNIMEDEDYNLALRLSMEDQQLQHNHNQQQPQGGVAPSPSNVQQQYYTGAPSFMPSQPGSAVFVRSPTRNNNNNNNNNNIVRNRTIAPEGGTVQPIVANAASSNPHQATVVSIPPLTKFDPAVVPTYGQEKHQQPVLLNSNPQPPVEQQSTVSAIEAADRMLAMQLQDYDQDSAGPAVRQYDPSDEEKSLRLALQLQEEEDRLAAVAAAAQGHQPTVQQQGTTTGTNSNSNRQQQTMTTTSQQVRQPPQQQQQRTDRSPLQQRAGMSRPNRNNVPVANNNNTAATNSNCTIM